MNLPAVLDVALGLIVLYLLLSTICSFGVELLANWLWWRKILLYQTIARLVTGKSDCKAPKGLLVSRLSGNHPNDVLAEFWSHPLAVAAAPDRKLPSYIEPSTFAAIVIDLGVPGATTGTLPTNSDGLDRLIRLAATSSDEEPHQARWNALSTQELRPLRNNILAAFRACGASRSLTPTTDAPADDLRRSIEKWYNEAMSRSSGEYKRRMQGWLLLLGLTVSAVFNADTLRTIYVLSTNDTLRSTTAAYAATIASGTNTVATSNTDLLNLVTTNEIAVANLRSNLVTDLKELQKLQQLGFPLGWKGGNESSLNFTPYDKLGGWQWLIKVAGLFATALAISLGAPFWFDLLNKLASLRSSGSRIPTTEPDSVKANTSAIVTTPPGTQNLAPAVTLPIAQLSAGEFGKDLIDARVTFSSRRAYWLAEAALLAYSEEAPVRAAVQQWGLDLAYFFVEVEACQGYLAVSADKKIAVLAFRGTEKKLEDWQVDTEFKFVKSPIGPGQTHYGFTSELNLVYDKLAAKLQERLGPDTLLYLTGHSLGAALATLMAARLVKAQKNYGVHSVHTFGSPRVGDLDFAKDYELALGHCTYRVVNAEDLVTRVPPRIIPGEPRHYEHVGQIVFFDSDGDLQLNAGFWERFLNTVINAVQDFRDEIKTSIKDHSMELYVRLLKKVIS